MRIDSRKHRLILKPEFLYVGITRNSKQYTKFTDTEIFTVCKVIQPIQHESGRQGL